MQITYVYLCSSSFPIWPKLKYITCLCAVPYGNHRCIVTTKIKKILSSHYADTSHVMSFFINENLPVWGIKWNKVDSRYSFILLINIWKLYNVNSDHDTRFEKKVLHRPWIDTIDFYVNVQNDKIIYIADVVMDEKLFCMCTCVREIRFLYQKSMRQKN